MFVHICEFKMCVNVYVCLHWSLSYGRLKKKKKTNIQVLQAAESQTLMINDIRKFKMGLAAGKLIKKNLWTQNMNKQFTKKKRNHRHVWTFRLISLSRNIFSVTTWHIAASRDKGRKYWMICQHGMEDNQQSNLSRTLITNGCVGP